MDTQLIGINLKGAGIADSPGMLSSYHVGGAHALMADGHVRFIGQSIDPVLLEKLSTVANQDLVNEEEY